MQIMYSHKQYYWLRW